MRTDNAMTVKKEQRGARRINPAKPILVKNYVSGDPIGSIVNLSETGMMLTTRDDFRDHQVFQTRFWLDHENEIMVGIENLWLDRQSSGMVIAGFIIIDISKEDQQKLKAFISRHP